MSSKIGGKGNQLRCSTKCGISDAFSNNDEHHLDHYEISLIFTALVHLRYGAFQIIEICYFSKTLVLKTFEKLNRCFKYLISIIFIG